MRVENSALALMTVFSAATVRAADRDDLYVEVVAATGINLHQRQKLGALVGYVPRDDIGVGLGVEQLYSTNSETPDEAGVRGTVEFRWFQEPFEFSADLGLLNRFYRDSHSQTQVSVGVSTAYLIALTPSLAAKADFSFLFLDQPHVLFSGGLGARILF